MSTAQRFGGVNRVVDAEDWRVRPKVSRHAELRWLQRGHDFNLTAEDAWVEGYPVGVPTHYGKGRIHPPTGTILLSREGVIVTVVKDGYIPYRDDHLLRCGGCELRFQPRAGNRRCPWCDHDCGKEEAQ